MTHTVDELYQKVVSRIKADPSTSYTAQLLDSGTGEVARKVGEEALETVIEALIGSKENLIKDSADLIYHLTVLWVSSGIDSQEVWNELKNRSTISGLEEKRARRDREKDLGVGV